MFMSNQVKNKTTNENASLEQFGYEQQLKRALGLPAVCLFGFAYLAPCTIFSYYGLIQGSTHGMMSLSYLIATIAMFFTALSYRQMVKAYPIAGSVYNYVSRAIHPNLGFVSGWAILLDYILLPMINYIIASLYIPILLPNVPTQVDIIVIILIVTTVNLIGVKIMSTVDNILIVLQLAFVVACIIFAVKVIVQHDYSIIDLSGIYSSKAMGDVGFGTVVAGSSILCLCFLGFDSVTTLAEETHDPGKTVGRALLIVSLSAGAMFVIATYLFQLAWPNGWKSLDPDNGSYQLVGYLAGQFMGTLLCVVMIIACFGSAISSQASCARILFGMGRDGRLPKKFFGHVSEKTKVPNFNVILIGVASLLALTLDLEKASTMINFGALLGFTLVNISVIAHYWVKEKRRDGASVFKYIILPVLGACVTIYLLANLGRWALTIGCIWLAVGVVVLAINTKGFRKKLE
jgi:putrescine importer